MMDTCYYTFVQTHRMCNTNGLCVIMLCQCGFITCNKYTTLVGGLLIMGEAMHLWRQEVYGNSLYHPSNLAVNLKLPLKIK